MTLDLPVALGLGLAGLLCTVGPLLLAAWWHKRSDAPYRAFAYGALIFIIFQLVLRLPWQIPLAQSVMKTHPSWAMAVFAFAAVTAGLFEEIGRYLGYKYLLRRDRTVPTAIMYGLGHGGAESVLLVGLSLLGVLTMWMLAAHGLVSDTRIVEGIRVSTSSLTFGLTLLDVVERASAIALQVGFALIVLQVFTRGEWRWLALAIGIHAAVDFVGVVMHREFRLPPVVTELAIAVAAIATLWVGLRGARWRRSTTSGNV